MVKRENEAEASSSKRSKKHKRKAEKQQQKTRKNTAAAITNHESDIDVEEQSAEETVPGAVKEEQVINENLPPLEKDCVEVEIKQEPEAQHIAQTANKPVTNKKGTAKLSITPPANNKTSTTTIAATATNAALATNSSNSKKSKKRRDSGTSSDEERWLTAIESGKLEDVDDELKKIKDPKLMTARQRAMYERNIDMKFPPELLMSLPTGYREKEKTAEDIQKAVLKSQKRKQQADEKREKDKKKTMDRLLKKKESKQRTAARNKPNKITQPMLSYRNNKNGATIQMPLNYEFPLAAQKPRTPPQVQLCGITGCGQPKVYNCSKTNLPLCSFACYRKNVQAIRQIMC